jgi:hypothetical protein
MNLVSRRPKLLALLAATIVLAAIVTTTLLAEERDDGQAPIASEDEKLFWHIDHSQFQVAPEKRPMNPDAGLTNEQRMQRIEDGRAMQRNFATGFLPSGGDPRGLQRMTIEPYSAGYASLEVSVDRAHLILVGKVTAVEFRGDDSNDGAHSRARVAVCLKSSEGQPD